MRRTPWPGVRALPPSSMRHRVNKLSALCTAAPSQKEALKRSGPRRKEASRARQCGRPSAGNRPSHARNKRRRCPGQRATCTRATKWQCANIATIWECVVGGSRPSIIITQSSSPSLSPYLTPKTSNEIQPPVFPTSNSTSTSLFACTPTPKSTLATCSEVPYPSYNK